MKGNYYRVRKNWQYPDSEIATTPNLGVASKICDRNPGTSVFNRTGTTIYSPKKGIDIRKKYISKTRKT